MTLALLGITILWIFLYGYLIIASIDFGAGFFAYYSRRRKKDHIVNGIIQRYLSPVWEVTNVFLIFFIVGIVGFFPDTAYYYGTALLIPGSLALVLLSLRGSFYAFAHYGARDSTFYYGIYGITGLLLPAALSTVLVASEGGFIVEEGNKIHLLMGKMLATPYTYAVILLALVSVLFISATFLTFYANKAGDKGATKMLHSYAMIWSLPTIIASLLVFWTIQIHNPEHYAKMLENGWFFVVSFIWFMIATFLLYKRRAYGWAFIAVMLQFFFAFFGYGKAHLPYLLYPYITITDSINSPEMGKALVIGFIAGLCLLVPSLILLMRLFLFDAKYVKGDKKNQ
ncbi:cytochrome d ubiquinol oxidase subunit II [Brevibacillus laterosporus]|uniref:Cytochrome d ubiquinol oxidase subunit II n=2 Tax=Brevibacillus TaxID=55080 RepID=A0AAP3DJX8_BRELA|nr:cytochrome d ubiquinol oxidase subunit II [Brevibacillus laterosporus]ATO49729.1 cytochrome D ubiquinol oxidase subunit II [Brevibacillus laterosporus DSM 25]AYB40137.1 cytochrome d ubiquinol oxidase subunit II [Brevibacillus laterosporus]MBG9797947.1 cytochrome D ubiquinol oxidase subunit II [Brevibacillus laterosporus]MBG9802632.1 cytochrome D ubiquinol oxidase subunit II [Brevibacillus laterosporus]MBM7110700.1 putative cytochrome bd menaquinol oxidase subunit II [Brevibacillus laterospo